MSTPSVFGCTLSQAKECAQLALVLDPVLPHVLLDLVFCYLFEEENTLRTRFARNLRLNDFLQWFVGSRPRAVPVCELDCGQSSQWITQCTETKQQGERFRFWCSDCLFQTWNNRSHGAENYSRLTNPFLFGGSHLSKHSEEYRFWQWSCTGSMIPQTHYEMTCFLQTFNEEQERKRQEEESENEEEQNEEEEDESEQEEEPSEQEESEEETNPPIKKRSFANFFS